MSALPFAASAPDTLGIELELQLLNRRNYNLATDAVDLLDWIEPPGLKQQIKLEITQGMIELNSGVHTRVDELLRELTGLRAALIEMAQRLNIGIAGGGAHPFQHWSDQRITPGARFEHVHRRYGYLAKTFTVFGQHIHIGVAAADDALYLTHAFGRLVPHFIALSAASPFYQGVDTSFDSSRSNVVRAFPLAGTMPPLHAWAGFEGYFEKLRRLGIATSMKDFYWDVRPKPEYGTVEIRVCDTPLTLETAVLLGAYAQLLGRWLLAERPFAINDDFYLLYQYNRFEASRYGLHAEIALHEHEAQGGSLRLALHAELLARLQDLRRFTRNEAERQALQRLRQLSYERVNDAAWLRQAFRQRGSLNDMMRMAAELWMTRTASPFFL